MVLELNASDDRGIDVVRDQIRDFASTRTFFAAQTTVKLVILDEADAMTAAAQAALRRVIEKYVKNVRFCLICNYVSGIIPALQSRCTRFRFGPLRPAAARSLLQRVCAEQERAAVTDEALEATLRLSSGDMRRALNVLQSAVASFPGESISPAHIYRLVGVPGPSEVERVFGWLAHDSFTDAHSAISRLLQVNGYCAADLVRWLFEHMLLIHLSDTQRSFLTARMAKIEERLNRGCSDVAQVADLVAAFVQARVAN